MHSGLYKYLVRPALGILGFLLCVVLLLHTSWGLNLAAQTVLGRLTLFEHARLTVDAVEGSPFSRLSLKGVRLTTHDDTTLVSIERVQVGYRLWPMLKGRFLLTDAVVNRPEIKMKQLEDATWDLFRITEPGEDTTASEIFLTLNSLTVEDGLIEASAYSEGRDSTYRITGLEILLNRLEVSQNLSAGIDHLHGSIWVPHQLTPVELELAAGYDGTSINLDSLSLRSENSHLDGKGRIFLSTVDSLLYDNELTLRAAPLAFDDIRLFVPGLAPGHHADIDVRVTSHDHKLSASAELKLSDNAGISLQGSWRKNEEGLAVIEANGRISEFNPALIAGPSMTGSTINGKIAVNLTGNSLDSLSGESALELYDSRLAGHALDSTSFQADFYSGTARITALTGFHHAILELTGVVNPFADLPSYDLRSRVARLNVDPYLENDWQSDLNAEVEIKGRGFSLDDALSTLSVHLLPSRFNHYAIDAAELDIGITRRSIKHHLSISGIGGAIRSEGKTTLDKTITFDDIELDLQQFDFAGLLGDTLRSSLTSRVTLDGSVDPSGEVSANFDAQIDRMQIRQFDVRQATLSGAWNEERIDLTLGGAINTGSYLMEGTVGLGSDSIAYEITKGRFDRIDIGTFLQDSTMASSLSGSFFLVGSGFTPASMSVSGGLELEPSMLNQQPISAATTWFALSSDTLNVELDIALPGGASSFAGQIAGLGQTPGYSISKGEFRGIDIGKIAGVEGLSSNLNGVLLLTGRGMEPATMTARADLLLDASRFNQIEISRGKALLNVAADGALLNSEIRFGEGGVTLHAEANSLSAEPAYTFSGAVEEVDIARMLGSDSTRSRINLGIAGGGKGFDPRHMSLMGSIIGDESTFKGASLDTLHVVFKLDQGLLTADTLFAVSSIASVSGKGVIAVFDDHGQHASDFSISAALLDLSQLEDVLGIGMLRADTGQLTARVFGGKGDLRIDARAIAGGFVYDAFHLGELNVRVTGELDAKRSLTHADATGQISAVSIPGFVFEEINMEASYDSAAVQFATNSRLDRGRTVRVSGGVLLDPEGKRISLDLVDLNLDEDQWRLKQPAILEIGSSYRVDSLVIESENQRIALDGVVDLNGLQDLRFDIENFNTGTVADLLGFPGLDGPLTTHVTLEGPANAPEIHGNMAMHLISFGREIGDLSIFVDYDSLQLNLDAALTQQQGNGASLQGLLPVDLTLKKPEESTTGAGISQTVAMEGGVDLTIHADSMAIDWILPFIDPKLIDRLEGALTAHITVTGTAKEPVLEGTGRLVDGSIRSPLVGVTYDHLTSDISLRENVVELTNAEMRSGDGWLAGNGSIELSDLTNAVLDINVTASQFLAVSTRDYRATASGNLDLTGSLRSPVLNGDINLISADVYLNESASSEIAELKVQLSEADLLMLEREFGIRATAADTTTFDFLQALQMDLGIRFERDVWIRSKKNPEMNIQFSGELDVSKAPHEEYIAFGSIQLIPERSYINQFGKRFDITLGNLTFNGPATDPQLDFEARYDVPARRSEENAVTIFLDAKGQVDDLDLTLRSEPTMELTDIISYIATGQPASEALQLGGAGSQSLASTGAGFALNQGVGMLTGAIEGLIQESGLELDVIQIEPLTNARGATITAGKYVTPRIFTAVSQPIGGSDSGGSSTEGTVITLELELVDSLLLRLLGGESVLQINLLWHHAY